MCQSTSWILVTSNNLLDGYCSYARQHLRGDGNSFCWAKSKHMWHWWPTEFMCTYRQNRYSSSNITESRWAITESRWACQNCYTCQWQRHTARRFSVVRGVRFAITRQNEAPYILIFTSVFFSHQINTNQSAVFFSHSKSTPATVRQTERLTLPGFEES